MSKDWRVRSIGWGQLTDRLRNVRRTKETSDQYRAMSVADKGRTKDVGGFVGGPLVADGPRKSDTIKARSLVTLDIDYGRPDSVGTIADMLTGRAWCLYSTHSHTPAAPRYRLIVPLSREVTTDEYGAISRKVAEWIDINTFDDSTYQPVRLMYWPSCPSDGEFVFEQGEGGPLDADAVLGLYADWRDVSLWPTSSRVKRISAPRGRKMEDPTLKSGVIGAFCRRYGIMEAIMTFIPDVYLPTESMNRWTYSVGSTVGGAIVYDNLYLYSHHGTDPCCGREVNAFDLVRIHKFGQMDQDASPDTPVNRLPSYEAMQGLAMADKDVSKAWTEEKLRTLADEFGGELDLDGEDAWLTDPALQWHDEKKKDYLLPTSYNFEMICTHDRALKDSVRLDIFTEKLEIIKDLPWLKISPEHKYWTDTDDNGLQCYVSKMYRLQGKNALIDAHDITMRKNYFHPVRDYLERLEWDGVERLDSAIIDYLGAADTSLNRAMTRKHFTAAVARIYDPGVKYDYVLTFIGPEGIGKSTFIRNMGREWFSDTFSSNDIGNKESMEQLLGKWLIELGELTAYKKNTSDSFKVFLAKTSDDYRQAYGRKMRHLPRQCVFFSTTNEYNFLKGDTGNRRFWCIAVGEEKPEKDVFAMGPEAIDQLWAEAVVRYKAGEKLYLEAEMEKQARERQESFNEISADDRAGLIAAYLSAPLPFDWYLITIAQRAEFFRTCGNAEGATIRREYICVREVMTECLNKPNYTRFDAKEVTQILHNMGLEYVGSKRTNDKAYGIQKRFRIPENWNVTCNQ